MQTAEYRPIPKRTVDRTGMRYGRLTVVGYSHVDHCRNHHWHCVCDCGGTSVVRTGGLTSGGTRSCGCIRRQPDYTWAEQQYQTGATLASIAEHVGVSKTSVMKHMRTRGITQTQEQRDEWRFWHRVDKTTQAPCWVWIGPLWDGYGKLLIGGVPTKVHRFAYELLVGPVPVGLVLDHLCRNRCCVNPAHLEPVTPAENALRGVGTPAINAVKTHCIHGHEFTPENTISRLVGGRDCRRCANDRNAAYRRRQQCNPTGPLGARHER